MAERLTLRVGVAGIGGFARQHHLTLLELERRGEARLVCACDPRVDALQSEIGALRFADRRVRVFPEWREMLSACGGELDYVVIATPIQLHADMHADAVSRGIAVYLEKPPTLDHAELEHMIETDAKARHRTLVAFNFIVEEQRRRLKTRLLAGEFGALRSGRLSAIGPRAESYFLRNGWAGRLLDRDGAVVLDSCMGNAMAHYVHNLLFWVGTGAMDAWAAPATVAAQLYRAHAIESADTFFVECITTDGIPLRLALTHASAGDSTTLEEIECEHATLRYRVLDRFEVWWKDGRREEWDATRFDGVLENHLAYNRYLRGESARPGTTLEESRAFVQLVNLAHVSSGEITTIPPGMIQRSQRENETYLAVTGMEKALRMFLAEGVWPTLLAERGAPRNVSPADLGDFLSTVRAMAKR